MRMEALQEKGRQTAVKKMVQQCCTISNGQKSRELIAQEKGESNDQIRRFIRLTELVKPMLDLVDTDTLPFGRRWS